MNTGTSRKLFLAIFMLIATSLTCYNPILAAGKAIQESTTFLSTHANALRALGTLLHIPYIHTLDSCDPQAVRLAGILAALPTDIKLTYKFLEKNDKRFFQILFWNVPKFGAYTATSIYDIINVLNPEHMVLERQSKGAATLRKMKIDQSISVGIEFILRIIACIAQYKASDIEKLAGGRDLTLVAKLTTELADIVELMRLLSRYNTYSTMPGCDISWNFEIKHIETPQDAQEGELDLFVANASPNNHASSDTKPN